MDINIDIDRFKGKYGEQVVYLTTNNNLYSEGKTFEYYSCQKNKKCQKISWQKPDYIMIKPRIIITKNDKILIFRSAEGFETAKFLRIEQNLAYFKLSSGINKNLNLTWYKIGTNLHPYFTSDIEWNKEGFVTDSEFVKDIMPSLKIIYRDLDEYLPKDNGDCQNFLKDHTKIKN